MAISGEMGLLGNSPLSDEDRQHVLDGVPTEFRVVGTTVYGLGRGGFEIKITLTKEDIHSGDDPGPALPGSLLGVRN